MLCHGPDKQVVIGVQASPQCFIYSVDKMKVD
jgi:hypothetical protein